MRKSAILIIALALPALAQTDYHKTTVTRWAGPGEPTTYAEYIAAHPVQPLSWTEIDRRVGFTDETGPVLVVVEETIYAPLQTELDRYMDDLIDADWEPILVTMSGGTAEDLRGILQSYWTSDGILGATLVGDLPVAWFELYEDFDNDGIPDNPFQVEFPCDLYYMDLDGSWYDGDADGMLDTHMFAWEPDIFIGQLIASTLGNEIDLISNYFDKNHAFRTGQLYLPGVGLAYIDDDWSGSAPTWGGALALATGLSEIVGEIDSTTAADYVERLDDGYYATLLCAHSSPALHQFTEQQGTVHNNVFNWQIQNADVHSFFYNCFNCSGCRYVDPGYIGGWYAFGDTYGQSSLGSTKTGSMLYFEDFYGAIADGECVGEAFRIWYELHGQEPGSVMWSQSWFYGMTHIGDATLFMKIGVAIEEVEFVDDGTQGSSGDGDGNPDAGETVAINLTMLNQDQQNYDGIYVKLSHYNSLIDWLVDSVYIGSITSGSTAQADGFLIEISEDTPDDTDFLITAETRDNGIGLWGDSFNLNVRAAHLALIGFEMTERHGNGDLYADPGEMFDVTLQAVNQGGDDFRGSSFTLESLLPDYVATALLVSGFASLAPGETGFSEPANGFLIAPDCPLDVSVPIEVSLDMLPDRYFLFQIGDELNYLDEVPDESTIMIDYAGDIGYNNQWHVSDGNSLSAPYSYKQGGTGGAPYWPLCDAILESPLIKLGDAAELRFWHWMEAEVGFDGGYLEINAGDGWERITPVGGYPGNSVSNGSYPGGPCYNGDFDWQEAIFDISAYAPFARLRFRFGSDGGVHEEGWYIDDISLTGDIISAVEADAEIHPSSFSLQPCFPNPFNPVTAISYQLSAFSFVNLTVYDLSGRKVAELVNGWREAGSHEVTFDAEDMASGIYLFRLEAGEFSSCRKMVLVK